MKDLMGMMGKVKELQSKMEDMQNELEELEAEGMSAGGMVTVTLTGTGVNPASDLVLSYNFDDLLERALVSANAEWLLRSDQLESRILSAHVGGS